uniref:Alpha-N-arabinofuranosidase n=1 Tax=uncultured bacterium contig00184 TaxID=1181602 RepID=A0A806KDV3_9BACT|nr:alpha-N-arabinofuranosidase [uncultured bacterium contig00184]
MAAIFAISPVLAENPIINQKYTADPNAIVWNDRLYVYCSYDNNNPADGGYDIKAYTLVSTDDMANWTDHGEVFRVPRDLSVNNQAYAPGAAVKDGKVYLYVPDGGSKIGAAYADRPEGPFEGGKSLITGNATNNTNVPWLFDPMGFVDDDGQGYIYFGGGPSDGNPGPGQNLRGAKLNSDMMSVQYPATTISDTRCSFEAAYVHKRGSTYYFSYSTNFSCNTAGVSDGTIAYLTSNNPLTGFAYKGIMLGGTNGNNHASPVEYKDKWYLFYHDRKLKSKTNANERPAGITTDGEKRSVAVDILEYESNGNIKQVTMTDLGPAQIKNLNPFDTVRAVTINTMFGISTMASPGGNGNEGGTGKEGKQILSEISNNDWIRVKGVDFGSGATKFKVWAAAASGSSGSIELRKGSNTGDLIGTCNIASTGNWTTWSMFECDVANAAGVVNYLYLVFKGSSSELFRLDKYIFEGTAASSSSAAPSSSSTIPSSSSGALLACANFPTTGIVGVEITPPLTLCEEAQLWSSRTWQVKNVATGEETTFASDGFWPADGHNTPGEFEISATITDYNPNACIGQKILCGTITISAAQNSSSSATTPSSSSSEESTPILTQTSVRALRATPQQYYNLKGEPLGTTKPSKPGVYIEKNGKNMKKVVIK